jgi:hypothetical protein
MQTYRDDFKVPGVISNVGKGIATGTTGAAQAVAKGANTAAKGVKDVGGLVWQKVLGFLKMLWEKFKIVISCVCCLCVLSCCFSLGIPQSMTS